MPYIFRCAYCGEETVLGGRIGNHPGRTCNGCGTEICTKCANYREYCDDCTHEFNKERR